MLLKRYVLNTVFIIYAIVTVAAFIFTMTGWKPTGVPKVLLHFSYGMMAPFQGYTDYDQDLLVEGQKDDGTWHIVDHKQYFPFIRGERIARSWLMYHRYYSDEQELKRRYRQLAGLLQTQEAKQGREWNSIRLSWQTWFKSTESYEALRYKPFDEREFILIYP